MKAKCLISIVIFLFTMTTHSGNIFAGTIDLNAGIIGLVIDEEDITLDTRSQVNDL